MLSNQKQTTRTWSYTELVLRLPLSIFLGIIHDHFVAIHLMIRMKLISSTFAFANYLYPTFDPELTSPAFSISIGDLLVNSILCLWISIFLINNINFDKVKQGHKLKQTGLALGGYFTILSSLVLLFLACNWLSGRWDQYPVTWTVAT